MELLVDLFVGQLYEVHYFLERPSGLLDAVLCALGAVINWYLEGTITVL